jgi:hypothetical protein
MTHPNTPTPTSAQAQAPTQVGWRRQAGFSLGKTLVWAVLGFGLYTGWCFLPAHQVPSHMSGSVENFLKHLDHTSPATAARSAPSAPRADRTSTPAT